MTNQEFAAKLEAIASIYKTHEGIRQPSGIRTYADTKDSLRETIKIIGGRWTKDERGYGENYQVLIFTHTSGLEVQIDRDKVCRKIVRYECDPVMSPEEEAELLEDANA